VIGRTLSHYDILENLGAGGMGVVYRARDTRLGRDVAIKVLPTDRPLRETARARFQREAMAASSLNHPNIITIYEIGNEDSTDFIVMELVRGTTLASLVHKRELLIEEAIRYGMQIADALTKAHAAGIIHRDLKPGNIMITEDALVKVLDFGLAKFDLSGMTSDTHETAQVSLTQPGTVTGTVAYMSPEQARGERVDARSDIFSFGVVLYEMLCGQIPFAGPNSMAVLHNLHFTQPRDITELRPKVPRQLVFLLSRTLEKKPDKRIQTMSEVLAELRKIAGGGAEGPLTWHPSAATIEMVRLPSDSFLSRFSLAQKWMAVGLALVLIAATFGGWRYWNKPKSPSAVATTAAILPGDTAYSLFQRARQELDHGDRPGNVAAAIQQLERAIQLNPQSAASYAALSEAYYQKNRANPDPQWMKLASENATHAVALDDFLSAGHISLGAVEMESGNNADAEKQFKRAAELDPKSSTSRRWLGQFYQKAGKSDQAMAEFKQANQLNPNDPIAYSDEGVVAYQAGNFKDAAAYLEKARSLDPNSISVLRNLGAVYHDMGRDDDAVAALQHAIEIQPNEDVYNNLATILFYQGKYDESVPAFEKTVALNANSYDIWGNLGDAYRWSTSKKDKAPAAYQTAIRLVRQEIAKHPDQIELQSDLAMYLAKIANKNAALETLKPVEEAHSKEPGVLYTTALTYELCGERDKALQSLRAAVQSGQGLNDIKNEPELVSLRSDPRYQLEVVSAAPTR